jgi:hypothetical protein
MNFSSIGATPANAVGLGGRIERGLAQAATAMRKIVMHGIIAVESRAISPAALRSVDRGRHISAQNLAAAGVLVGARAIVALPRRNDVGVVVGADQMKRGIGEDWLVWPILTADRSKGAATLHARAPCS